MNIRTTQRTSLYTPQHGPIRVRRSMTAILSIALLSITVMSALIMSGCREEVTGIVNVCLAPTVIRTTPAPGGTNESLNKMGGGMRKGKSAAVKLVTATFSTPMDPRTITNSTFFIMQGATVLPSTVSYTDTTAIMVIQGGLSPNLTYTCTVTNGVRDLTGTSLAANYVWTFTTLVAGTPTLSTPIDGAVAQPVNPILAWNTVAGASSYRLQVALDPGFLTLIYNDSTRTNTSQLISGLAVGTTYYWRVNSKIAGGSSFYSTIWSFTTITVPSAPVLIDPLNSAVNIATNPIVRWNASAGAASYHLQISTTNSFVTTVYDSIGLTNTSKSITGLTGGTVYYWRVNATNAAGTSLYSSRSFTTIAPGTPTLIAPLDGAANVAVNPMFVWNAVPGASSYRLQVSTSNTFGTTFYNDSTLTNPSQVVPGLTIGTTYFWRVSSKNSGQSSDYSDVWSFTTIAPPTIPVLVSPLASATNQPVNPTLIWNGVPGAETYRLQVSTDNTFATTFYNDSTRTNTSQSVPGLTVGTVYFWRVNAKNTAGTSSYSVVRSFTTIVVPAAPVLFAPADLAITQPVNPSLIWNAVPGAATYRLQVSLSNTFATMIVNDSTVTSTSQQVTGLSVGTVHFWRVYAKNAAGTSVASAVWSFTTVTVPIAPVLLLPLDAAVNQAANLTLAWNSVPGASTYRLQVSVSNTFATTVYNDSTRTNTSQQMTALSVGTVYFWRVNAKNAAGTSLYSPVWSFSTSAAPLAPVLLLPVNLAVNQPSNPTLSWTASVGAVTYRLQVSTVNTFATTVTNDSTITGVSQQQAGLLPGTTYFWRVNAKNVSGTSPYSVVRSFTTTVAPPLAPVLLSPLDASIAQKLSLPLSWNASVGASTYRLQVDTSQTFAVPIFNDSTITGTLQAIAGLKINTTYYWRVNAKNGGGTSVYSAVWRFTTGDGLAPGAVPLKSVGTYGIMATSAITNTGFSIINGDVSLDPGTSMTGFPPGVVNGTIHINDTESAQARLDLLAAYNFAKGKPAGTTIAAGADLGALYPLGIPPGTYTSGSTMLVSTDLVLDGGGNADAVWVFQVGSSLTTGANVTVTGGAQAKNIFWVPTLDATIGVGTTFTGTIVSGRDVTAVTGSTVNGRILAGATTAGTIALQTAVVNVPLP